MAVPVDGGTANTGTIWMQTATGVVLDTTALTFAQIGTLYLAGTGLSLSGSTFNLQVPVSVANGGTNATTASAARASLAVPGIFNSGAIGDGASTSLTVTHSLNNNIPMISVYDVSGTHPVVIECDVTATDANNVSLSFAVAPATGSIKCVVTG
jgi:hypothetical protein